MRGRRQVNVEGLQFHGAHPLQQVAVGHEYGNGAVTGKRRAVPPSVTHCLNQRKLFKLNSVRNSEVRYKANQVIVHVPAGSHQTGKARSTARRVDHLSSCQLDFDACPLELKLPAALLVSYSAQPGLDLQLAARRLNGFAKSCVEQMAVEMPAEPALGEQRLPKAERFVTPCRRGSVSVQSQAWNKHAFRSEILKQRKQRRGYGLSRPWPRVPRSLNEHNGVRCITQEGERGGGPRGPAANHRYLSEVAAVHFVAT